MPALPWLHPDRANALLDALRERILIIDGAMGTMIQRHGLQEDDYRGERFADGYDHLHGPGCDHATPEGHDLKGNNDLLLLTRPQIIADIHTAYPKRARIWSRPTPSTPRRSARPTTTSNTWCTN